MVDEESRSEVKLQAYIEDVRDCQRNTVWPDLSRNGRSIDEVLFKGVRKAPLIQRVGILVFAVMYLMAAVALVDMAVAETTWTARSTFPLLIVSLFFVGVAGWMARNAFRK